MITSLSKLNDNLWFTRTCPGPDKGRLSVLTGPVFSAKDQQGCELLCSATDTGCAGFVVQYRQIRGSSQSLLISEAIRNRFAKNMSPVPGGCHEGINEHGLTVLLRPSGERALLKRNAANPLLCFLDRCRDVHDVETHLKEMQDISEILNSTILFLTDRNGCRAELKAGTNGIELQRKAALEYGPVPCAGEGGPISQTHALDLIRSLAVPGKRVRQIRIYNCETTRVLIFTGGESYEFSPLKNEPMLISNKVFRPASLTVLNEENKEYRNTYEKKK